MAGEDAFDGAKAAFSSYFAFFKTVAQEIGMERTLALGKKTVETMAAMQANKMKEETGIKEFDAKTASSLVWTIPQTLGITREVVEESPQRVMFKVGRCPIYEAAQTLGLDPESACHANPLIHMDALVKQLNPNLSYRLLKYRTAPDDFCEEEIVLV